MTSSRGLELIERAVEEMREIRQRYAGLLGTISELDHANTAKDASYANLAALIAQALHMDRAKAARMVAHATQVAEELTPTGHVMPAPLPTVREALRAGLIDDEHIHVIGQIVKEIPTWASLEDRELLETTLGTVARTQSPSVLRQHGLMLVERINQDGHAPNEQARQAEPVNSFTYRRTANGRIQFRGELEPEIAEVFENLLIEYGKPQPPVEGVPDPRSTRQRYGDAVSDIIDLAAGGPDGASKPRMILTMDHTTLTDAVGTATLESGCPLSPSAVRRLACDADLIPMVLNGQSVPLDRGRATRLVTGSQREALIVRDKGCAMPGCTRPARICDAHHIKEWLHGGRTDLRNLVLLCRHHHRQLHHSDWEITVQGELPYFIPPKWIDPLQRPIRNILRT